jgi:predicted component of type VI protein secretion system
MIYSLSSESVGLGRDIISDLSVNDPEVSRQHARLTRRPEGYIIEDLGSTNGTFVNGVRITGPAALSDGDVIGLGETVTFAYQAAAVAETNTVMAPGEGYDLPAEAAPPPPVAAGLPPTRVPEPVPALPSLREPEPQPAPVPPPLFPSPPEPIAYRAPTTATPVPPPSYVPVEEEKPKSRRGLLIGCGCLVLLIVCAAALGVVKLLWDAPAEFWQDPISNFDKLFGIILPLLPVL